MCCRERKSIEDLLRSLTQASHIIHSGHVSPLGGMLRVLRKLWRSSIGREYFSDHHWRGLYSEIELLRRYTPSECARLRVLAEGFLHAKAIEGAVGLEINDDIKRVIAVQACVPILNLSLGLYAGWYSVVVYPGTFRAPHEYVDEAGVVHKTSRTLSGESWHRGPVVLSWQGAKEGAIGLDPTGNVVIHEFVHKLDLLNGKANGMPPLHSNMDAGEWTRVFTSAFEDFCWRSESGYELPFSAYGTTSPGEFFAVASEAFFVQPDAVHSAYSDVYRLLNEYYRQDPGDVLARP